MKTQGLNTQNAVQAATTALIEIRDCDLEALNAVAVKTSGIWCLAVL
jgi:hypothetical protein